jgi:LysR family glycine cleavage system transcriptional activator
MPLRLDPDFAAKWLVHRIGRFSAAYPDIDLRISASLHHVDFAREDIDLAVRHGDGNWSGLEAVRLSASSCSRSAAQNSLQAVSE